MSKVAPFDMALERSQLHVPMCLQLVEPGLNGGYRTGAKAEQANPGVTRWPFVSDDPGLKQHPQVSAHRRAGHPGGVGDLARPAGAFAQQLDDLTPGRIGQRVE